MIRPLLLVLACLPAVPAAGQVALDRANPFVIQAELPPPPPPTTDAPPTLAVDNAPIAAESALSAPGVFVGAIRVVGLETLRPADFARAIEPFVGRRLALADQEALIAAVTAVARGQGLVLASAGIEPQGLQAAVLRVRVEEGRVDAVRLIGAADAQVERTLATLIGGGPVRLARLERALLLAGDVAGARVSGARLVREGARNVLTARLERNRFGATVSLDNWGTRLIGPVNAGASVDGRGLIVAGDHLQVFGAGTPLEFREYRLIGGRYLLPLDAEGTVGDLTILHAHSRPGGRLRDRDIAGDSFSVRAEVQHPLIRRFDGGLWIGGGVGLRDVEQRVAGRLLRAERAASLVGRASGSVRVPGGVASGTLWLTQGLGALDGTRAGDPLASRDDGDARFTKVELRAAADLTVAGPLTLALAGEAQFASRALLVGDEMGLGGSRYGRGYDFRERSGDEGVAGSAELRVLLIDALGPIGNLVAYGYGDGGSVWNLGLGDGRSGALYSAGGGVRARLGGRLSTGVEVGVPLNSIRDEAGDRRPRLSFETALRF